MGLQGVQQIQRFQQVRPLHAHPVDKNIYLVIQDVFSSSPVGEHSETCDHRYLQRHHEVQRVQQLRKNQPHPNGKRDIFC